MGVYKTYEEFYNDAISKGLKPLEDYLNYNTNSYKNKKIKFECLICGKILEMTPRGLDCRNSYGCKSCMQRKTQQQFIQEMKEVDPNIEVIGNYISSKTKIKCKCKICNFEWERIPNDLLRGFGCPKCNNNIYYTNEQFKKDFYQINDKIELKSDFVNHRTPILCKCKIDDYEWEAYPYDLLNNRSGCRMCNNNASYTLESLKERLKTVSPDIIILSDNYQNNKTPIKVKCKKCNCEWNAIPQNLLGGRTGCPNCSRNRYKLEEFVKEYLDNNQIDYIKNYRFNDLHGVNNGLLSYDFKLINMPILIECQGIQHYKPVEYFGGIKRYQIQVEHDRRKKDYALKHKMRLIEISKKDIKNIDNILDKELLIYKTDNEKKEAI